MFSIEWKHGGEEMGTKLLIVGAVLTLSGGAGLLLPARKRRGGMRMGRLGPLGDTLGASFALLFGIAFLIAGVALSWRGV